MSNYNRGESADLFDPVTGRWVGVIDQKGNEALVPTYSTDTNGNVNGLVDPKSGVINVGVRTTPVRVVTFGDSTANVGTTTTAANQDVSKVIATTWNTGLSNLGLDGSKYLLHAYYPQSYFVGNGGVSGENTTQMLARDSAAISVTRKAITDMLDLQPNVVLLRGGSINDLLSVTSSTLAAAVTTAYNNHVEIINRFISRNVYVIDLGIYGFTNGSANTATDLASTRSGLLQLNALFKTFAAANPTKVKFVDLANITYDSTGAYLPNISIDGTHLSLYGQYLAAQQEAIAMTQFFGVSSNTRYQGFNNFANSIMTATSTAGGFGTVATNCTITTTLATRQNAKIEYINGKQFQTCEFAITATSNNGTFSITFDPSATGAGLVSALNIVSGDIYGFEYDFYFEGLNGITLNGVAILARLDVRDSVGSGRIIIDPLAPAQNFSFSGIMTGHLNFPPFVFGDNQAQLTNASVFTLSFSTTNTSGTYKIGVGNARCVKLDQAVKTI
jgi:lysophospholipase L1-like esterase